MDFDSELNYAYRTLISEYAERILSNIIRRFVRHAQSLKRNSGYMLSPEDSGLDNLWDEICVDCKSGTLNSAAYELYIEQYVKNVILTLLPDIEKTMLFISSEGYEQWLEEEEAAFNDGENEYKTIKFKAFDADILSDCICKSIIGAAMDYSNARIEEFA